MKLILFFTLLFNINNLYSKENNENTTLTTSEEFNKKNGNKWAIHLELAEMSWYCANTLCPDDMTIKDWREIKKANQKFNQKEKK